jgi:hypothetical protein
VLLTGSGDDFCDPLPALLRGVSYSLLFSFIRWGSLCPGAVLIYAPGSGWGSSVWCVVLTCFSVKWRAGRFEVGGGGSSEEWLQIFSV